MAGPQPESQHSLLEAPRMADRFCTNRSEGVDLTGS